MSCKCLAEINNRIIELSGDPQATVDYAFLLSGPRTPRIGYTYRKQKRDGTFNAKESEGTIIPTCCPWCGVKYDRGEP